MMSPRQTSSSTSMPCSVSREGSGDVVSRNAAVHHRGDAPLTLTDWRDIRNNETQKIHHLVMIVGGRAWMQGGWVELDGFTLLEDETDECEDSDL